MDEKKVLLSFPNFIKKWILMFVYARKMGRQISNFSCPKDRINFIYNSFVERNIINQNTFLRAIPALTLYLFRYKVVLNRKQKSERNSKLSKHDQNSPIPEPIPEWMLQSLPEEVRRYLSDERQELREEGQKKTRIFMYSLRFWLSHHSKNAFSIFWKRLRPAFLTKIF